MNKKIVVTGGSGLVGSHLREILPNASYLSSKDYNLADCRQAELMVKETNPDVVVHLAARVGGLLDNMKHPVEYLEENILMNTNVLKFCHKYDVENVITMLSTCVYPDVVKNYPMTEKDLFNGPPPKSNFTYGLAKRCTASQIESYTKQYDKKWSYLIPCNLYGEYDKYTEHNSHFVSALIKKIHESDDSIELWGTGKPLRQFMYGADLAKVILYFIENKIFGGYNVAPNFNYSIAEMASIAKAAIGKENLSITYDSTKPDGQFRKDVDSSKLLNILNDFKFTELEEGIKLTYSRIKDKDTLFRVNG